MALPTTPSSGSVGIKISQPGFDATNTQDYNLLVSGDFPVLKIAYSGTITIDDASQITTIVTHNLGYVPFYLIFRNNGAAADFNSYGLAFNTSNSNSGYIAASITDLKYFPIAGNTGNITFTYYLFRLPVYTPPQGGIATGTISIVNVDDNNSHLIPQGAYFTQVETGLSFITTAAATVPAGSFVGGVVNPGVVGNVPVQAVEAGAQYNLAPYGDIVPNGSPTPITKNHGFAYSSDQSHSAGGISFIYGVSSVAFAGGSGLGASEILFQAPIVSTTGTLQGVNAGSWGAKVARAGQDAGSSDLRNFVIHSKARSPLLNTVANAVPNVASDVPGHGATDLMLSVNHNLSYVPLFYVMVNDPANTNIPTNYYSSLGGVGGVAYQTVYADTTRVAINDIRNPSPAKTAIVILKDPFAQILTNVTF